MTRTRERWLRAYQSARARFQLAARAALFLFSPQGRRALAGAAALIALVACLGFAPGRSWAQRVLAMLRVQKIAAVPVETVAFEGVGGSNQAGRMVSQFLSENVVVTMRAGAPVSVADSGQASQLGGFRVRLLAARADTPRITVQGEQAFQLTLNRERLESILDEFGRRDLELPASVDGALVAVHIPKAAFATYGDCPRQGNTPEPNAPPAAPAPAGLPGCVMLAQVPSPTVSVPPDLDIRKLAEMGLEAAGMSPQDAQAFSNTVDWTSTLVLPVPRNAGASEPVSVDGVEGTLITLRGGRRGMPGYSLWWVKAGIIYCLTAAGSPDQAVPLADSLE